MTGFTGVIWESRPAERLEHDLTNGAGPAPLAEAGVAWTKLAAMLGDIELSYRQVIDTLAADVNTGSNAALLERMRTLVNWFGDSARLALENARRAEAQSAANSVALLAMPSAPELHFTQQMQTLLTHGGGMLGAPALGLGAQAERVKHEQAQRASQAMQQYEAATTPVAKPWHASVKPAEVVSDAMLAAGRNKTTPDIAPGDLGVQIAAGMMSGAGGFAEPEPVKTAFRPATYKETAEPAVIESETVGAEPVAASAVPPMGGATGAGIANQEHAHAAMRPSVAHSEAEPAASAGDWQVATTHVADGPVTWDDIDPPASSQVPVDDYSWPPNGGLNLGEPQQVAPSVFGSPDGGAT